MVQLVNSALEPAPVTLALGDARFSPAGPVAVWTLVEPGPGPPNMSAANTPARPTYISPALANATWPAGSSSFELTLPAFSFTVVEVRGGGPAAPPAQRAPPEAARPPLAQRAGGCPAATLVWQPSHTQYNATSAPGNKYGVEDGIVVRRADGAFTMICAEMYGDPKWVAMQLGVFHSADGLAWTRVRGLRRSTGDLTGASPHSSSWGPFFTHDSANDTWLLSYVGYRGAPSNSSGWLENFQGTIFSRFAGAPGDAGLDGDFSDAQGFAGDAVLLAPDDFRVEGPWPHPCQGLQGTDSMFPFQLNDGSWAAFVGTSHQETPNPWPQPGGGKWPVSLARAPALGGPWARFNPADPARPADAPCVDLNGGFSENPIVSRRPDDPAQFQVVIDDLGGEARGFAYACSADGLNWARAAPVAVPGGVRTPFGLLPMTPAEVAARAADIIAYGVLNATALNAPNTSLQWLFFSQTEGGWESFRAAVVQLRW